MERCESDVEGEVEAEQLLLTLTDRFLEEKSHTTGKVGWSCDYHVTHRTARSLAGSFDIHVHDWDIISC